MVQLEHWGCPWSRRPDGDINVRFFGGMSVQRTWFAADKSGFHILHTLFQTSIRFPSITCYDEFFVADLLVEDGRVRGVLTIQLDDHSRAFNTEFLTAIELGFMLEVAEAMAHAALQREESRDAHVRLDEFSSRDDEDFLKHSLASYRSDGPPEISWQDVVITTSPPRQRNYRGVGRQAVLT
jgi:succinate dehydrogenase/fumarate reductase flavoprotein subunit